jgi:hypothetical protein
MPGHSFMVEPVSIAAQILQHGVSLVGDLVRDGSTDNKFYAFVKVSRDNDGAQNPTNHKLRTISDAIANANSSIELVFVLVEEDSHLLV